MYTLQAYPDFDLDEPFILTTDWLSLNIAGVLSQKQDGVERFLCCWGRKCNRYERHYSSAKGELLALVKCMKKWEHILKYWPPFLVYTDAASLMYIVNLKSEESIFQHWYTELAQFEFIVRMLMQMLYPEPNILMSQQKKKMKNIKKQTKWEK